MNYLSMLINVNGVILKTIKLCKKYVIMSNSMVSLWLLIAVIPIEKILAIAIVSIIVI